MIGGTVTVGAFNSWSYSVLINRYFKTTNSSHKEFDFSGMGLDLDDTIEEPGATVTVQSIVAEKNVLYVFYSFRLSHEYEAQLPKRKDIYAQFFPEVSLISEDGQTELFGSAGDVAASERNPDGSFDGVMTAGIKDGSGLGGKILEFRPSGSICAGTKEYVFGVSETGGVTIECSNSASRRYSLEGITYLPAAVRDGGVTLKDGTHSAVFDSVTVSPLRISFYAADIMAASRKPTDPIVIVESLGSGWWCIMPDQYDFEWLEYMNDELELVPALEEYILLGIRTLTLVYDDGTETDVSLGSTEGRRQVGQNESGFYTRLRIDLFANFAEPVNVEGVTAIRVNGNEITMN